MRMMNIRTFLSTGVIACFFILFAPQPSQVNAALCVQHSQGCYMICEGGECWSPPGGGYCCCCDGRPVCGSGSLPPDPCA